MLIVRKHSRISRTSKSIVPLHDRWRQKRIKSLHSNQQKNHIDPQSRMVKPTSAFPAVDAIFLAVGLSVLVKLTEPTRVRQ